MTYDEAITEAARALNAFLADERRQPATVTTLPQAQPAQTARRRQRTTKAA